LSALRHSSQPPFDIADVASVLIRIWLQVALILVLTNLLALLRDVRLSLLLLRLAPLAWFTL